MASCSPSAARSWGKGLGAIDSFLVELQGVAELVRVPVARESSKHCTPWFAHGSGCLGKEMSTDSAKGVVMILAEQTDPVVIFAVVPPRGTSLLRHPNKIIIINKL